MKLMLLMWKTKPLLLLIVANSHFDDDVYDFLLNNPMDGEILEFEDYCSHCYASS